LACAGDPDTLGLRVPQLAPAAAALAAVPGAILQTSANLAGGPEAARLADVPEPIRAGADLVLDAGELTGAASTVIDLRRYADDGELAIVREGALPSAEVFTALQRSQ